jgi:6-phosphogluconolactonase (cycloisomerase 2 family)
VNNQLTFLNSVHSRTTVGTGRWYRFGLARAASKVSATPKFAYVLNNQDKTISTYSIDGTSGALTQVGSAVSTGGINPQAMAMDWYGNFLYVVNQDSNTVSAFTINRTTGALTTVAGSPFATGPAPSGVAVEGTARVLYVGTSGDDSFYVYYINSATGALTLWGSLPTGQCVGARTLVADWRGTTLYQACTASNKIAVYSLIPEIGGLTSTSPSQVVTVGGPSFALSPYGLAPPFIPNTTYWFSFAFLVSQADQQIKQFFDGNTGQLSLWSSGPLGPNQGMAVDPLGRFAYGTNTTANNVQADAIDPSEGTLTEAVGSPWGTGTFPIAAAVDTTGRFLYVVNRDSNTVSGFTINQQTGALTQMSSPTFATGNKPVAILTTGTIQ